MTRQTVTTLIFIAAGSVGAAASQKPAVEERGAIQRVVTRAGTTDPLNGAEVTLQVGAANPQGRLIHVGQDNTVNAELTIIR